MEPFDFTTFDFINRSNAEYIELLYHKYQTDPRSVDTHWRAFFAGFEAGGGGRISSGGGDPGPGGGEKFGYALRELGEFVFKIGSLWHKRPGAPPLGPG